MVWSMHVLCILLLCIFSMHCLNYFRGAAHNFLPLSTVLQLRESGQSSQQGKPIPPAEPAPHDQAPTPAQKFKVTALKFG